MKRYKHIYGMALFFIFIMMPGVVHADVFMRHKLHTDACEIMGNKQPARDSIQTVWITKDKIRTDDGQKSSLVRLDKKVIYFIDHSLKTYYEMPLDVNKAFGKKGMSAEEEAKFQKFSQGMMKMEITITDTGETKRINKWKCRKYLQHVKAFMGPMDSEIWATEELKMDKDLQVQFLSGMMASMPNMQQSMQKAQREMQKIKGVPVLSIRTTSIMNSTIKSLQELVEYKDGTAPKGTFDVPKGYNKKQPM